MGLEVSSTSQRASFPFGAQLSDVRLISTRNAAINLLVESPAVTIAPSYLSMLTMHPGVRVKAALYDGVVNVTIRPTRLGTAISYDLDSVELARQQLWTMPGASAAGALSGTGNLLLSPDDIAETGDGILSAAGLTFTSALTSAPLRLGDGHSKFKLDQGTLDDRGTNNHWRRPDANRRRHHPTRPRPGSKRTGNPIHSLNRPRRRLAPRTTTRNPPPPPRPRTLPPDRYPGRPPNQLRARNSKSPLSNSGSPSHYGKGLGVGFPA